MVLNPEIKFSDYSASHPSVNSTFKRIMDIVGGLVGLLILALLFIPIALVIKLDSPGAVFYNQTRYGLQGKPFTIRKFRSMVCDADAIKHQVKNEASGLIFKNENDPRITKVGCWLRKTSLDELPQFWNVLVGEMSLVGTRPPTADEVAHYNARHWRRLDVKPGITGEWQVRGRSQVKDFEEIVELDLHYQQQWSLGYDLAIVWKTIDVVCRQVGAC